MKASGRDLGNNFNEAYLDTIDIPTRYGNNIVLNISVDNLSYEYERVKNLNIGELSDIMYINISAPYWCFWLTDPDGNCLEVTGAYTPS